MSKIHFGTRWHISCWEKNITKKEYIMTNFIKNRNAAPAAFGSVLDQLFPTTVSTLLDDSIWGFGNPNVSPVAPVNILETAESFELELAAPGLQKSDFQLKIEGDTLTISLTNQEDRTGGNDQNDTGAAQKQENKQSRWVRREFTRPAFQRHFELGDIVDRNKISARYENGVLYLTLPKKERLRPVSRQIDIN